MRFELPWPPTMNHYYTVARGRKILSRKGRIYKALVRGLLFTGSPGAVYPAERLALDVTLYPPRLGKWDLDNRAKPLLDAMNGLVYGDDSQLDRLTLVRGEKVRYGRCEIFVEVL